MTPFSFGDPPPLRSNLTKESHGIALCAKVMEGEVRSQQAKEGLLSDFMPPVTCANELSINTSEADGTADRKRHSAESGARQNLPA